MKLAVVAPVGADGFYLMGHRVGAVMDELRMLDLIHRNTPAAALPFARIVTYAGATPTVWTIVGVSALLACGRSRSWAPPLRSLCTLAATALARRALAEAIDRPRPPRRLWRAPWSGPSFPSRHTTLGTTAAGLAATALTGHRADWVAVPVGAAIGASRLVLGVHWPSDVLAGWAFAAVALTAARRIRTSPSIEQPHHRAAHVRAMPLVGAQTRERGASSRGS